MGKLWYLRFRMQFYSEGVQILTFDYSSAQIMYAFLMRPDTLPRSYTNWWAQYFPLADIINLPDCRIGQAAKVPAECIKMNIKLVREHTFDIAHLDKIVSQSVCSSLHSST
jgi:hypothetical protein